MEGATLLCNRDRRWDYKFREAGGVVAAGQEHRLKLPSGVFVCRAGTLFHPTTHSVTSADWWDEKYDLGLVREPHELISPITVTVAGRGSVIVTNTGRAPLSAGQRFVVTYPTEEDVRAQTEAVKLNHAKATHTGIEQGAPLWGGFMATVGHDRHWTALEARVTDEVVGSRTGLLYSLGELQGFMRRNAQNGGTNVPQNHHDAVLQNNPTPPPAVVTAAIDPISTMLRLVSQVADRYRPRVHGVVQHALIGNSPTIPTGAQFHAVVVFE